MSINAENLETHMRVTSLECVVFVKNTFKKYNQQLVDLKRAVKVSIKWLIGFFPI
jgi:hypothetical protein